MRILFLSRWYPDPPDNGSKIRILNLLRSLCERHSVHLISFTDPRESSSKPIIPGLNLVDISVCPYYEFNPHSLQAIAGYFSRVPRSVLDTYSKEMESLIRETVGQRRFDLIIASQLSMAIYCKRFDGIPAIFEELELGSFYPDSSIGNSIFEQFKTKLRWAKYRNLVSRLLPHFISCTVASDTERKIVSEAAPEYKSLHLIPNSIDLRLYDRQGKPRKKNSLIFTGSLRYIANYDAVNWFLTSIYPTIRSEVQDLDLKITGDPGERNLSIPAGVTMTGRIQNVHDLIAESEISLAPIRTGGGTRLKILEAFALRTPVVATSKAAEGIKAENGTHFLRADTSEDFARSVLHLLRQPEEAGRMADRAFNFVHSQHNWENLAQDFMHLVEKEAHKL